MTNHQPIFLPALCSVVVHIGALFTLLMWHQPAPLTPPPAIATTLVDYEQFSTIKAQLNAPPVQNRPLSPPVPTARASNAHDMQFQAQLQQFTQEQNQQAQMALQSFEHHLKLLQQQEPDAFAQQTSEPAPNSVPLPSLAPTQSKISIQKAVPSRESAATDLPAATNENSDNKTALQAAVIAHIKQHWQPIGTTGTTLNANIQIDASGRVLSVYLTGGTEAQRQALEAAILDASPITPLAGTEFRSFSPYFVIQ